MQSVSQFGSRLRPLAALWGAVVVFTACASLPENVERSPSSALRDTQATALAQLVAALQPPPGTSGFRLLAAGDVAYDSRLALINRAERSLDLQYYAIIGDPSTAGLFAAMRQAAARGVRVRLLLDDLSTAAHDQDLARFAALTNVQVRIFNPFPAGRANLLTRFLFSAGDFARVTRRMHNKLFIADNALAIAGGRNLGAGYFRGTDELTFADLDVLIAGPAVTTISNVFDQYWNNNLAYPIHAFVKEPPPAKPTSDAPPLAQPQRQSRFNLADLHLVWARGKVLADDPDKLDIDSAADGDGPVMRDVLSLLRGARRELLIISPYLIPSQEALDIFAELRKAGVSIRVLTNSLATTDAPAVHGAYARRRPELLQMGVAIHELRPTPGDGGGWLGSSSSSSRSSLHAKAVLVDGRILFVGSLNLDPRSASKNTEDGLIIASNELAEQLTRIFEQGTSPKNSYVLRIAADGHSLDWVTQGDKGETHYSSEPEAGFWRRLITPLLDVTLPENLL
jgi:cardiolipin synthase C